MLHFCYKSTAMSRKTLKIEGDERAARKTCGYGLHSIRALTERDVRGLQSATPLFLFTCENFAFIFYLEPVETKKYHCETTQDN